MARELLRIADAMPTREIDRSEWDAFFDFLSGMAHGWLVTLEVTKPGVDPRVRAYEVPLEDIQHEVATGESEERIAIVLRELEAEPLTVIVRSPQSVRFREDPQQGEGNLEIVAATGTATRLSFRHLPLPTQVDGLLA